MLKNYPSVKELKARHATACDLKQAVDRKKIEVAIRDWCAQINIAPDIRISFVEFADEMKRAARDARDARAARAARDARDARAARDARDARDAWAAWAAWAARDARAAWAARAARAASFEVSWLSITAIGAVELKNEEQARIWMPILAAFEAGCYAFFVTDAEIFIATVPTKVSTDSKRRLHCEDGPAFVWLKGMEDFYWHGVYIPSEWITDKKSLSAKVALKWKNVEQRRAALEIVGWANVLKELKAVTIDEDPDPQIGKLVKVNLPDIGEEQFIIVECGTKRTFALPMPPHVKTALEGQAWSYAVDTQVIKALHFRT